MSRSIASKTLAIAKKHEAERLKAIEEEFLDIMRKEFEERVDTCNPWTAVGTKAYSYHKEIFNSLGATDIKAVAENVGFKLVYECGRVYISIPEWVKGQKRTQAQLMLYWSNIEINRNIKSRKAKARKMCTEVLEKIKKGDFVTEPKHFDYYEIVVTVNYSENNREFEDEATKIFAKKNFQLIRIYTESVKLRLEIRES